MSTAIVESPQASWTDRQSAAAERFAATPAPKIKDELWRFANVKLWADVPVPTTPAPISPEARQTALSSSTAMPETAAKLIFSGTELLHSQINEPGFEILTLEEAMRNQPDLMDRYFLHMGAPLGSAKFAALHEANLSDAVVILLSAGCRLQAPIEIWRWISGTAPVFPHLLLVGAENSEATILEHLRSLDNEAGYLVSMADIIGHESSTIRYSVAQDLNLNTRLIQITSTLADKEASVTSLLLNVGGAAVRQENLTVLREEGSKSIMLSASLMDGARELDQRTLQRHDAPGAFSDLLYKNVLDDDSRAVFSGLIQVAEGAHRTDAYQKCRNLLLTDRAEANAMPGLEINADQVKCSHGATCGAVDEEQLFYFGARGIPSDTARRLIAAGFAEESVEKFDDPAVAEWMRGLIERRLEAKI